MSAAINILHVEDSENDVSLVARFLKKAGYDLVSHRVDTYDAMAQALKDGKWDMVFCDHSMPNFDTASALELIAQSGKDIPMVIVSGAIDETAAVTAMKAGVRDYVMKDSLGRLIPILERELLAREIRMQKRAAEQALADQVKFLQELLETVPAAIFFKDRDGTYLGCNRNFAVLFGRDDAEQIKGRNIFDLMSGPDALLHNQIDTELMARGGQTVYEASLKNSEGKPSPYMIHKAAYADAKGKPAGLVGVLMDITELKKMEETRRDLETQLRQAQKLEAIGTLAGGIAHDFNNILAAISGYCELAMSQTGLQPNVTRYLDQVLGASDRAKGLIKQILTFSRKAEQAIQPVNVGLIAKEALKLLKATLPPSIEILINIDTQAGLVSADPSQVHQLFMNLCTNAAHAMKEKGGTLKVEIGRVKLSECDLRHEILIAPDNNLQIKVADTGHGMSKATMERIFDPYFTTKAHGEGTGLGLSVVHGIIKGIGGSIAVQSELGKGSVFSILLPLANEEEETAGVPQAPVPKGNERIMVVDDETAIAHLLATQLARLGYEVKAFDSGDKAWAYYQNNPQQFDAIITDLLMPGMQGSELIEKSKHLTPDIPIIIYTGINEGMLDSEAKMFQADAVFLKPTLGSELASVLRELLDKKKTL